MADGLRAVLAKYGLNEEAISEIEEAATPDTFRSQLAELGAKAKRTDELESRLASIESAPKRREALARVGIDYDAVPKYGQKALDALPTEDLEDLAKVAKYVQEQGFEANIQPEPEGERSGAEQISEFMAAANVVSTVMQPKSQQAYEAAVAAAETPEDLDKVYRDFNKAPAQ